MDTPLMHASARQHPALAAMRLTALAACALAAALTFDARAASAPTGQS